MGFKIYEEIIEIKGVCSQCGSESS
jgi:Fe2+ or Zn2+ uptake regulation protein